MGREREKDKTNKQKKTLGSCGGGVELERGLQTWFYNLISNFRPDFRISLCNWPEFQRTIVSALFDQRAILWGCDRWVLSGLQGSTPALLMEVRGLGQENNLTLWAAKFIKNNSFQPQRTLLLGLTIFK